MSLTRKNVVQELRKLGVPEGWKESALLRNCFAMRLNADGRWAEDATVRLDNDLGLVYEAKESE
jgi:CRISPR-associated endonuclease/helicase Cas3